MTFINTIDLSSLNNVLSLIPLITVAGFYTWLGYALLTAYINSCFPTLRTSGTMVDVTETCDPKDWLPELTDEDIQPLPDSQGLQKSGFVRRDAFFELEIQPEELYESEITVYDSPDEDEVRHALSVDEDWNTIETIETPELSLRAEWLAAAVDGLFERTFTLHACFQNTYVSEGTSIEDAQLMIDALTQPTFEQMKNDWEQDEDTYEAMAEYFGC